VRNIRKKYFLINLLIVIHDAQVNLKNLKVQNCKNKKNRKFSSMSIMEDEDDELSTKKAPSKK